MLKNPLPDFGIRRSSDLTAVLRAQKPSAERYSARERGGESRLTFSTLLPKTPIPVIKINADISDMHGQGTLRI